MTDLVDLRRGEPYSGRPWAAGVVGWGVEVGMMKRSLCRCVGVLAVLCVLGLGSLADHCTITVQPGESIQAAINRAPSGAVICLEAGTWRENLEISKSLTLQGVGADRSVIRGREDGKPVMLIESDSEIEVEIKALTVAEGICELWSIWGIRISGSAQVTITGSVVARNDGGAIRAEDSSQVTVVGSVIEGKDGFGWDGISIRGSAQFDIADSIVTGHEEHGIIISGTAQATVQNCTISRNGAAGDWSGFSISGSTQATISDSTVKGSGGYGISMGRSAQVTITDSTVVENEFHGIAVSGSAQVTITDSDITRNKETGIALKESAQATVVGNRIIGNNDFGVALWEQPCADPEALPWVRGSFQGYVDGRDNVLERNGREQFCPADLSFLTTEEGGELDRRE